MRWLVFLPLAVLVVLFALSNRQVVEMRLWPLDVAWAAPLAVAVLVPGALAFLLGAAIVWLSDLPSRRRGWTAQRRAAALQREIERLHALEKSAAADRLAGSA